MIFLGMLALYFGSGISGRLKETYQRAKQRNEIIETLTPPDSRSKSSTPAKSQKDWTPELEELLEKASKLRGGGGQPPLYS
jgi:hypothetical protein